MRYVRATPQIFVERLEDRTLLAGLVGQYFDSVDFTDLKLTRTDATVDFTWTGAPTAAMGADFFSVRWRGQVKPQHSQEYTFYVNSDDGARLWVDGRLLIDNWVNQVPTEKSAKITLEAEKAYDIRLDYYEFNQASRAQLSWSSASVAKQVIPSSRLLASSSGLGATYYDNQNFTGAATSRTDAGVNFNWGSSSPAPAISADTFSARWTGYLQPQHSQTYTFHVTGDVDSFTRLRVDGQIVADSASVQDGGVIQLEANKFYDVELEYTEGISSAYVRLEWSSPALAKQVIPSSRLFAAAGASIPTRVANYTNSVENRDLPDPGILFADGFYWMTHTMGGPNNGWPLYKSSDMVSWTFQKHLLTTSNKPAFMTDAFWAPEIHKIGAQYIMTGTSWSAQYGRLVIALATSSRIDGPYTIQPNPIVADSVSVLDSNIFQDHDGRVYFLWKRDSNAGTGTNGSIRIREMNASGTAFAPGSSETVILDNAVGGWERNLAEAPWMIRRGGYYYLFYSGGFIDTTYSVGVASGSSPTGPFTRNPANPILTNNSQWGGPGHGSFALDRDGVVWHFCHSRYQNNPNYGRVQMLDRVVWTSGGWPSFGNSGTPTTTQQTGPRVYAASGAGVISLTGDAALADDFILRRKPTDSSVLEVLRNGATFASRPFAEIQSITLDGSGGNDTLVVDHSRGNAIPGAGVTFLGAAGSNTIRVIGSPDTDDTVRHAAGKLLLGTGALSYSGVQTLRLESGQFAFDQNVNNASVQVLNAALIFNATQTLKQLDLLQNAAATLAAGGSRVLRTTGLTLDATARLDLTDNDLILDYAGGSPLASIEAAIRKGFNGGNWLGAGITSSAAATDPNGLTALGVANNADLGLSSFSGVAGLTGNQILVKYTYYGDADLSGHVTLDDFNQFLYGYQNPGVERTWLNGDFDFSGDVTLDDFNQFLFGYQEQDELL